MRKAIDYSDIFSSRASQRTIDGSFLFSTISIAEFSSSATIAVTWKAKDELPMGLLALAAAQMGYRAHPIFTPSEMAQRTSMLGAFINSSLNKSITDRHLTIKIDSSVGGLAEAFELVADTITSPHFNRAEWDVSYAQYLNELRSTEDNVFQELFNINQREVYKTDSMSQKAIEECLVGLGNDTLYALSRTVFDTDASYDITVVGWNILDASQKEKILHLSRNINSSLKSGHKTFSTQESVQYLETGKHKNTEYADMRSNNSAATATVAFEHVVAVRNLKESAAIGIHASYLASYSLPGSISSIIRNNGISYHTQVSNRIFSQRCEGITCYAVVNNGDLPIEWVKELYAEKVFNSSIITEEEFIELRASEVNSMYLLADTPLVAGELIESVIEARSDPGMANFSFMEYIEIFEELTYEEFKSIIEDIKLRGWSYGVVM